MFVEIERDNGRGELILNTETISEVRVAETRLGSPIKVDVITLARANGDSGARWHSLVGWEAEQLLAALALYSPASEAGETLR